MSNCDREVFLDGVTCSHLYEQHGVAGGVTLTINGVRNLQDIKRGMVGTCVTGEKNKCPFRHKCNEVVVTDVDIPRTLTVKPLIIESRNASTEIQDQCVRPSFWFYSERARLERDGIKSYGGVKVEEMSYEPPKK